MKAININGQIKTYHKLPSSWGNVLGGFNLLSDDELKNYGFYDLVIPEFDVNIENVGDLYFDSVNEIFTQDVSNKTWAETLDELKEQKITVLNQITNEKLKNTDWYYIRKLHRNIDVPQTIEDDRNAIITEHNNQELEINALTKKSDVVKYEFR